MPAPSGFDHVSTTKSNSTRSIAARPCKERKGAPPANSQPRWRPCGQPETRFSYEFFVFGVGETTVLEITTAAVFVEWVEAFTAIVTIFPASAFAHAITFA